MDNGDNDDVKSFDYEEEVQPMNRKERRAYLAEKRKSPNKPAKQYKQRKRKSR